MLKSRKMLLKKEKQTRHWWLMSVVLAIQEAEIRRMEVQSQPWANSLRPYLKNIHHKRGWQSGLR
jgi:hypothetical protein